MPVDINLPLSPVTCIVAQQSHNKVAMVAEMLLHMLIAYSIIIQYYGYCHNIHITVDKNLSCLHSVSAEPDIHGLNNAFFLTI